ncbi:DUF2512 family protein [Virgibacillus kimchii]
MKHIEAILIKFFSTLIVLSLLFILFSLPSYGDILLISIGVTGIGYLIGDLYVLRKFGNGIAFFADFGLAAITIWLLSYFLVGPGFPALTIAILAAVFIAVTESMFHIYMNAYILDPKHEPYNFTENKIQTEFSDEENFRDFKK